MSSGHWGMIKGLSCGLSVDFHFPSQVQAKKVAANTKQTTKIQLLELVSPNTCLSTHQIPANQVAVPHSQAKFCKEKGYFLIVFSLILLMSLFWWGWSFFFLFFFFLVKPYVKLCRTWQLCMSFNYSEKKHCHIPNAGSRNSTYPSLMRNYIFPESVV